MSKVYNYMMLSVGLTFLLKFAGIPSGADAFITYLGLSSGASGIGLGDFFAGVVAVFAIGTGAGIVIGFFTKAQSESFIIAPLAAGIFTVITSTFISIVNYTSGMGYIYYITFMIFIPLLVSFAIALISYWRGSGQ